MNRKTWGFSSFGVGLVLAVLFGILSANSSGANSTAYLWAAIACAVAGVVGLLIGLLSK
jgi:phosphate/sulfate permease